jgi:hypothetical protein
LGEELWRRSTRTALGPSVMIWLSVVGTYLAVRTQWTWTRGALIAGVLLFLVGAVEAWRAEVIVGTEGVAVRRTFTRVKWPWPVIADFVPTLRGRRAAVEVVLTNGETRPILDWTLDADRGLALVLELQTELKRHR